MTGLTRLAIADTVFDQVFALFGHNLIIFHFCFLSAYSLIKLFVGTLYKTLDKYYQACYNQRQLRKMLLHQS